MSFSSIEFLFYFLPIVLLLYFCTFFSRRCQNVVLFIVSLFFYAWGEPEFVILMLCSIVINYVLGIMIERSKQNEKLHLFYLIVSVIYNLGLLFIFKYSTFVIININGLQNFVKIPDPHVILPIGISFFTFKAISYAADVYRGKIKSERNILNLALYIVLFPELLAGPISRYEEIKNQIIERTITWEKFGVGSCRFITGLGKKVLISNAMAAIVDKIYVMNTNGGIPVTLAWLGSIAYTLQIFFDFSGYSDMAIGLGLIFGFKFEENFNYPYISKSIREFWRRWHISLSSWFRDYVYIPLGGSKVENKDKLIRNLFVVWVLTGLWHGSEWTFVMWGLFNFVFIAAENILSFEDLPINNAVKHIYALFVINLGWVLFRSKDLIEAGRYIACMFGFMHQGFWSSYTYMFIKENIVFFIAAIAFSMPIARNTNKFIVDKAKGYLILEILYPFTIIGLFIICVSYLVKGTYNPFIYFKF